MTDTEPPAARAALLMARHSLDPDYRDADRNDACVCGGWVSGPMEPGWDDHLAEVLAEAGLLVPDTGQAREQILQRDIAFGEYVIAVCDAIGLPHDSPRAAVVEAIRAAVAAAQAPESPTDSPPKAGRGGSGEAETTTDTVQAPDGDQDELGEAARRLDAAAVRVHTGASRVLRWLATDLRDARAAVGADWARPTARALLGTDTIPDRLAWISEAGETAAAERQARYQETACARRPDEQSGDTDPLRASGRRFCEGDCSCGHDHERHGPEAPGCIECSCRITPEARQ